MIGLLTGIIQSLGVIPAFGLTEPTFDYYKEVLTRPDTLQSLKYSLYIAFVSAFFADSPATTSLSFISKPSSIINSMFFSHYVNIL